MSDFTERLLEQETFEAALESIQETLGAELPKYFYKLVQHAAYYAISFQIMNEYCFKNGYTAHKTEGYGWQVFRCNVVQFGDLEKLELFATYPDALRDMLNRINEDNQCE